MPKITYSLIIFLDKNEEISIGKLGCFFFKKGYYVYNGSALGGFGRVRYHLKKKRIKRWHIDYLLEISQIKKILMSEVQENMEHQVSKRLLMQKGAEILIVGFGSSDCNKGCIAHLIYFSELPKVEEIYNDLGLDCIIIGESNLKDI